MNLSFCAGTSSMFTQRPGQFPAHIAVCTSVSLVLASHAVCQTGTAYRGSCAGTMVNKPKTWQALLHATLGS